MSKLHMLIAAVCYIVFLVMLLRVLRFNDAASDFDTPAQKPFGIEGPYRKPPPAIVQKFMGVL